MPDPKATPSECFEGAEAFTRFDATMTVLLSIPFDTLKRLEKEYRKKVDGNPRRRGPKRKDKTPASDSSG
jgi:hypothetical protein